MTNKSPEKLGRGPDAPTNVDPQFPRSYKKLHGAPSDPAWFLPVVVLATGDETRAAQQTLKEEE